MGLPPLPPSLDATCDVDGFRCELRARTLLISLPTMRWLIVGVFLLAVSGAIALGPIHPVLLMLLPLFLPALLVALYHGGRWGLEALLGAPRRSRIRCTHDFVDLQVLVHGMIREVDRIPLAELVACRVGDGGLELHRRDGGIVEIAAEHPLSELLWVASAFDEALHRRRGFEADEEAPERLEAREAARALVARGAQPERS